MPHNSSLRSHCSSLKNQSDIFYTIHNFKTLSIFSMTLTIKLAIKLTFFQLINIHSILVFKLNICHNPAYIDIINLANQLDFVFNSNHKKINIVADYLILPMIFLHFCLQIISYDCNITTNIKKIVSYKNYKQRYFYNK